MPKASYKSKGGKKDSAEKNSFNPIHQSDQPPTNQTDGPQALDRKNRNSQGGGQGDAHQIKY